MVQNTKTNKIIILLSMLYMSISPIVAAQQPGDLDKTFGANRNGVVKSNPIASEGYSVTNLILRKSHLNDIVVSCVNIVNNEPYAISMLASYKANGSLNVGAFGTGNPARGYIRTLGPTYDTIASFTENGAERLAAAGKLTAFGSVGYINKTNAIGISLNSAQKGAGTVYHSVVVDQANQYMFAGGDFTTALQPKKSFKFSRFNDFSDLNNTTDIVTEFPGTSASHINSIALQSDGNIVVAGQTINSGTPQFTLARYLQDATTITLDTAFGSNSDGKVIVFEDESEAKAATMQIVDGNEKIVVAGWVKINNKKRLALVRYNLDGRPDTSFASQGKNKGKVTVKFGGDQISAHALAIDKNNKIVVVGELIETPESNPIFLVARYNADGTLDTSFGTNGWITTNPSPRGASLNAVAIDEKNRIVCGGYSINQNGLYEITLARYIGTEIVPGPGDLDASFGDNGIVTRQQFWNDQAPSFEVPYLSTGLVLRDGPYNDIITSTILMLQPPFDKSILFSYRKEDGSLNEGEFGTGTPPQGYAEYNYMTYKAVATITDAEEDKLIMIGRELPPATTNIAPLLVQANARTGAIISTSNLTDPQGIFNAVTVDHTNKFIFAAGSTLPDKVVRFTRFNFSDFTQDVIDNTTPLPGSSASLINSIALQPDGNIVAAGQMTMTAAATIPQFMLARYTQEATRDTTLLVRPFPGIESEAKAVAIQTVDDIKKIVAAGWVKENDKQKLALVRYNLDGTLDGTFGDNGIVTEDFGGDHVAVHAIAIDQNNRIIVAGEFSQTEVLNPVFIVASYNADGSLDTSFGPNSEGWVITSPTPYGSILNAVAIDENNNITCSGFSINQYGIHEITLVRYLGAPPAPGTLDPQFGNKGLTTTLIEPTPSRHPLSPSSSSLSMQLPRNSSRPKNNQLARKLFSNNKKPRSSNTLVNPNNKVTVQNSENNSAIHGIAIRGGTYNDIVVVGTTETTPISQTIASYNSSNGNLNTENFGQSKGYNNYRGFVPDILANSVNATDTANTGYAVAIQNNTNKIVTAGNLFNENYQKNTLAFSTFFSDGRDPYPFPRELPLWYGGFKAIAHAPNSDALLYAGSLDQTTMLKRFLIGKFNGNASDNSFNGGIPVVTNFTNTPEDVSQINAMAVYPSGRIVVAGTALINGKNRFVLARYLSNGAIDTTFGIDGKVITDFSRITLASNPDDTAYGVALQQVGLETRIVAVGVTARQGGGYCLALARYKEDGSLDLIFGDAGIRISCFGNGSDEARAVTIDEKNHTIVVAGISTDPINRFLVARYTQDGNIDTSFGTGGRVLTSFFGNGAAAHALALQDMGESLKIIVAGFAIDNSGKSQFALARYNI